MGAYNRVLGEPCCASKLLLQDILRGEWGFAGHVVSDCLALTNIHRDHKVTANATETAALALKAGCDLSCGCTYDHLGEALEQGLISEAEVDRALARTLATRFKLGMFDPPEVVPYASIPMTVVGSKKHRKLARQAAARSLVLLKNKDGILPIGPSIKSIFITGPAAASLALLSPGFYKGANVPFPIALIINLAILAAAICQLTTWSRQTYWDERHILALASGALGFFMIVWDPILEIIGQAGGKPTRGTILVALAYLTFLIVVEHRTAKRVRQEIELTA